MNAGNRRYLPWVAAYLALIAYTGPLLGDEPDPTQYFGARSSTDGGLIGIFYDFKQTQSGKPIKREYRTIIENFINQGWDESVLKDFYRSTQPLYATQIFIPYIDADHAPRAFGVDKRVKPRMWMVHYKGQVSSSTGGTFRFLGLSDDLLAVAVNSKTVLVAPIRDAKYDIVDYQPSEGPHTMGPCGAMRFGSWFTVKKDEIIDLDIIVGEVPGSGFGAWLQIQDKEMTYEAEKTQHAKFPVFQLVPQALDTSVYKWGKVPVHSSPGPAWKAIP